MFWFYTKKPAELLSQPKIGMSVYLKSPAVKHLLTENKTKNIIYQERRAIWEQKERKTKARKKRRKSPNTLRKKKEK